MRKPNRGLAAQSRLNSKISKTTPRQSRTDEPELFEPRAEELPFSLRLDHAGPSRPHGYARTVIGSRLAPDALLIVRVLLGLILCFT